MYVQHFRGGTQDYGVLIHADESSHLRLDIIRHHNTPEIDVYISEAHIVTILGQGVSTDTAIARIDALIVVLEKAKEYISNPTLLEVA